MFKRLKRLKKKVNLTRISDENDEKSLGNRDIHDQMKKAEPKAAERTVYLYPASMKVIGGRVWGYMNTKGKFVLPPIYEQAGNFQENGLAIIRLKGFSGVIDVSGYYIVKPTYDKIHPFSEGRAAVKDHQGFKVIDESGKELTAKAYFYIGDYQEGRVVCAEKDENGHLLYGYLNKRGKEVISPAYIAASHFSNGKAVVKMKAGGYALISLTGKELHTYPFAFVGSCGAGLLAFQKNAGDQFGYIDEQGNIVIAPKFTEAQPFKDAGAIVKENNRYGLIDRKGQYIFKPNYHHIFHLGEGRIAIGKAIHTERANRGLIYAVADTEGHILTGFIYNGLSKYEGGMASAFNEASAFFIDIKGNKIVDLLNVNGNGTLQFDKKLIKAEIDSRLFYFKKNGSLVWEQNKEIVLSNQYTVVEKKYKPNKDFLVYYPQIKGITDKKTLAKINQTLKDLAGLKETAPYLQLESNYRGDFTISFYKKDLVVFELTGCNHPSGDIDVKPVRKYAHIDLRTGEHFHLQDLFKPGSQYVRVISENIGSQINHNRKYSYIFRGSFKGIQADHPFYINKDCLHIYFSANEIAPPSAGFPTFSIPFAELFMMIDQSGAFWKSFE